MAVAGIMFVVAVVYFNGARGGPLHGHAHPNKVGAEVVEEWNITAVLKSGQDDNPNWVITQAQRKGNRNINVIARAVDWYAHELGVGKGLKSTSGYKGFTISHVLDGMNTGTNHLPACTLPNLEKALVVYTARDSLSEYHKHLILCTLEHCGKQVPSRCYANPKTGKPKIVKPKTAKQGTSGATNV